MCQTYRVTEQGGERDREASCNASDWTEFIVKKNSDPIISTSANGIMIKP